MTGWYVAVALLLVVVYLLCAPRDGPKVAPPRPRERHEVHKNFTVYGNASDFTLELDVANLVSLELLSANLPRAQYLIDEGNRWLDLDVDGTATSFGAPPGNAYTAVSLAESLSAAVPVACVYDRATATYTFTHTAPFALLFRTGAHAEQCLCRELGFEYADYTAAQVDAAYVLRSPNRADLSGARFVHVVSKELDDKLDRGLLAQIQLVPPSAYAIYAPGRMTRRYFAPCPLKSLSIGISDYDTTKRILRPYDFHGMFWCLVFQATVLEYKFPIATTPVPTSTMLDPLYWVSKDGRTGAGHVVEPAAAIK